MNGIGKRQTKALHLDAEVRLAYSRRVVLDKHGRTDGVAVHLGDARHVGERLARAVRACRTPK